MIEINGKIYRNLQEQVEKNKDDIVELQKELNGQDLTGFYTKSEVDEKLLLKADLVNGKIPVSQLPDAGITVDASKNLITSDSQLISADDVYNGLNKSLYNLGVFDTISGNVITRQTGYVDLSTLDWQPWGDHKYIATMPHFEKVSNDTIPNIVSNSNNYPVVIRSTWNSSSTPTSNGITVTSTADNSYEIIIGSTTISTVADLKAFISSSNWSIQYKLEISYTEEIIEGQPLITLDSQGSQWLRSEWEKGLNLFNGSRDLSDWNLIVGNTYTITTIDGTHSIKIAVNWYSSGEEGDILVESTKVTFTYNEDRNWRLFIDPAQTQEHENFSDYGIMCVEGNHAYPYQPYSGAIVHNNEIYPVGSIYMSVNSTSPASLFGGTWEQLKDRFLIGAGNSYAVNSTGGETTHTLTIEEMPKHYHQNRLSGDPTSGSDQGSVINGNSIWSAYSKGGDSAETGGSQPHNNMPPYLAVYMWKRTA